MWKPGQSGNPKGRPKPEDAFSVEIRKQLAEKAAGKANISAIVEKAIKQARRGDRFAREWLSVRGYGNAAQPITGEDGPLEILVRYAKH